MMYYAINVYYTVYISSCCILPICILYTKLRPLSYKYHLHTYLPEIHTTNTTTTYHYSADASHGAQAGGHGVPRGGLQEGAAGLQRRRECCGGGAAQLNVVGVEDCLMHCVN